MALRARWVLATAMTALLPAAQALAQDAIEPPRTGPNTGAPQLPPFAEPFPSGVAPQPGPFAITPVGDARMRIRALAITVAGPTGHENRPAAVWRASARSADILALEHADGEAMDEAWVRRQFDDLLNMEVEPDQLVSRVQLINRAYLENGYINSGLLVEGQDFAANNGVLALTLVFGRVVPPVRFAWGPPGTAQTPDATAGLGQAYVLDRIAGDNDTALNMLDLERAFRLLSEDPALRTINASVEPGARPGEAQLDLRVDPQPRLDVYAALANSRSPSVGGERASIGVSIRNVLTDGSTLQVEYGVTEGLADVVGTYSTPFVTPGLTLDVRAEANEAEVVEVGLRPLGIVSESEGAEAGLSYRLIHQPLSPGPHPGAWRSARTLSVGARLAHKRAETFLLGQPFSFSPGSVDGRTEVSVARVTADWIERDNEDGLGRVWALSATGTAGLDGTRSDIPGAPTPDEHFTTMFLQASHARQLNEAGLELRARFGAQWASSLLYSAERFSAGGDNTVRGYRENAILADSGAHGSVELSYPLSGARDERDRDTLRASVFADGAVLRNEGGPALERDHLSSVGVSLSWSPSPALHARFAYGRALSEAPAQGDSDLQDEGVHFMLQLRPLAWRRREG